MQKFRNLLVIIILALFSAPAFAQEFGFTSGASLGSFSSGSAGGFSLTGHVSVYLRLDDTLGFSLRGTQSYFFIRSGSSVGTGSATSLALTGDFYFGPIGIYVGPQIWIGNASFFSLLGGASLELFPRWRLFAEFNLIFAGSTTASNLRIGVTYQIPFLLPKS